jgi:hypothetical protein
MEEGKYLGKISLLQKYIPYDHQPVSLAVLLMMIMIQ